MGNEWCCTTRPEMVVYHMHTADGLIDQYVPVPPVQPLYNFTLYKRPSCTYVGHYEGVDGPVHVAQMDIVSCVHLYTV